MFALIFIFLFCSVAPQDVLLLLRPAVPASIETALVYFSHMWTVDGKMKFTHSRDDETRREAGAPLMLTAAVKDAAVNHFKYIKPSRSKLNAAPVSILRFFPAQPNFL